MGAVDRISYLPPNVTDQILQCLPLRDAVRTSILSTHWRFKWFFLPQLILDRSFFLSIRKLNKNGERNLDVERLEYLNIVNHILLFHKGPITKFEVHIPCGFSMKDEDISCWIHFVSCKLIKEFTLFSFYETKLPSWMFSIVEFNHLTHLTLVNGSLPYVSMTVRGFPCLISLKFHMEEDAIEDVIATGQTIKLGIIVSKCPLLENLNIEIYDVESCLTVHSPKLHNLVVVGCLSDIFLEETKRIKMLTLDVVLDYKMNHKRDVMEFFSCLPVVEKLILGFYFWENYFGKHDHPLEILNNNIHGKLRELKNLVLKGVRLHSQRQWDELLCIFNMAPKLQILKIEVDLGVIYEVKMVVGNCWLDHLKSVKFKLDGLDQYTDESVFQLIKMILSSSPVLEVMTIKGSIGDSAKLNIIEKLLRYRKASANAKIILDLK